MEGFDEDDSDEFEDDDEEGDDEDMSGAENGF